MGHEQQTGPLADVRFLATESRACAVLPRTCALGEAGEMALLWRGSLAPLVSLLVRGGGVGWGGVGWGGVCRRRCHQYFRGPDVLHTGKCKTGGP